MDEDDIATKSQGTTDDDNQKDYKYRQMLVGLDKLLEKRTVESLAVLAGFSPSEQDEIRQQREGWSHQLFRKLEQKGKIQRGDVSWLRQNLKIIDHHSALTLVEDYDSEPLVKIPDEPDSDDSDSDCQVTTFEDFLSDISLQDKFPQKLTLKDFLKVKDKTDPTNWVESFWQRLTSLDCRAGFPQHYMSRAFSMRDFIFSILHCADDFLRQDILEKMSACQLAVPIILQGVSKGKPEFLLWALRRIMKKWKGKLDSCALEQPIVNYPVLMISVLRIGDVRISKSQLLNTMLGYSQGNAPHAFFLSVEKDFVKPIFSPGSIECAWFLPLCDNDNEIFPEITAFFNLRGDCRSYPTQTKFACEAADLTIAFIATGKRNENFNHISTITKHSKQALFVAIREEEKQSSKPQKVHKPEFVDGWLFVKVVQIDVLSRVICHKIVSSEGKPKRYKSLESLKDVCGRGIKVDENKTFCQQAKEHVQEMFRSFATKTIVELKKEGFPLQGILKDWVQIDNEKFQDDNDKSESFELQRQNMRKKKRIKREEQLRIGFSETIGKYYDVIKTLKNNPESLKYFFSFLQDKIYQVVNHNTQRDLNQLSELKNQIKLHQKPTKRSNDRKSSSEKTSYRKLVTAYNDLHKSYRLKNLGCEHFLRELGQLFEAFDEVRCLKTCTINTADVALLPSLAARLVSELHSFELMDGDTGSVPLVWITNVLDALTRDLGDPRIMVISVIGVQSSGKSTLLNSMFGLRFPVRAGRCTRGLFFRLLELEETLANELGFSYLVVVDTEGIRSIDHDDRRFDNELVTLALSIANITIFNIEGENISPDMTGILQIAAHALMRMKEVDLECHCRIVQQRVSDLTAAERNKASTNRIKETLDEATKVAAEEEGLQGRYEKFSDVVDLQVDESLQYIPCLWSGGMSPPNHLYSDTVTKLKARLIQDIRDQKIIPDLTLSNFTDRVRDVWRAVKEDDFVFNFQDSVRAVEFNKFSLQYNKWIIKMRQSMMSVTNNICKKFILNYQELTWTFASNRLVTHLEHQTCETIESLKESLRTTAEKEKATLLACVEHYTTNHPQKQKIFAYKQRFIEDAKLVMKDVETQALATVNDEYELRQVQTDLPKFRKKWRHRLAISAKKSAIELHESGVKCISYFTFEVEIWKKWMAMVTEEMNQTKSRPPVTSLQTVCEKLLLRITGDSAVGSEVRSLMKEEGGIDKHSEMSGDSSKYVHKKFVKAWLVEKQKRYRTSNDDSKVQIEQERVKVVSFVKGVIDRNMKNALGLDRVIAFDENLYQLMLQQSLKDLTNRRNGLKPPNLLIAKGLLHQSCLALKQFERYHSEQEYPCAVWLQKEKEMLYEDLTFFLSKDGTNPALQCAKFLWYFINPSILCKAKEKLRIQVSERLTPFPMEHNDRGTWDLLRHLVAKDTRLLVEADLSELYTTKSRELQFSFSMDQIKSDIIDEILRDFTMSNSSLNESNDPPNWLTNLALDVAIPPWCEVRDIFYSPDLNAVVTHLRKLLRSSLQKDVVTRAHIFIPKVSIRWCNSACPRCGVPCSNFPGHRTPHLSFLHRPTGFRGERDSNTNMLVIEECCYNRGTHTGKGKRTEHFDRTKPKRQKTHSTLGTYSMRRSVPSTSTGRIKFENTSIMHINVSSSEWEAPPPDNPGMKFWHWVMALHNDLLAERYNCNKADIPSDWYSITKEEALESLHIDEVLKLEGRYSLIKDRKIVF